MGNSPSKRKGRKQATKTNTKSDNCKYWNALLGFKRDDCGNRFVCTCSRYNTVSIRLRMTLSHSLCLTCHHQQLVLLAAANTLLRALLIHSPKDNTHSHSIVQHLPKPHQPLHHHHRPVLFPSNNNNNSATPPPLVWTNQRTHFLRTSRVPRDTRTRKQHHS